MQEKTWESKQKRTNCFDGRQILSSAGLVSELPPQGSAEQADEVPSINRQHDSNL